MTYRQLVYYPWHDALWQRVMSQQESGRWPHAVLLTGQPELGKRAFAHALATGLLCSKTQGGKPCGSCSSCHLVSAGTHPDYVEVVPVESRMIRVNQIRALNEWVSQTASRGGRKVATIVPADLMNIESSNALLKCLEEPTSETTFILVTNRLERVVPTVRSRCQLFNFARPGSEESVGWMKLHKEAEGVDSGTLLKLSHGSPILAVERASSGYMEARASVLDTLLKLMQGACTPLEAARRLEEPPQQMVFSVLTSLFQDALKNQLGLPVSESRNADQPESIEQMARCFSSEALFLLSDEIADRTRELESTSNPNETLAMESLLVAMATCRH